MAERRMFAKTIIDSDAFLEMPISARLLYYDLAMRADDDGFINSPKKIMKFVGATEDDLNILIMRKFIIPFDNGIVVIKHWRIHNYIRKDMYHETKYKDQKAMLTFDENNAYTLQPCNELVTSPSTQVRLGKVRIGKDSIDNNSDLLYIAPSSDEEDAKKIIKEEKPIKNKLTYGEFENVKLTEEEYNKTISKYGEDIANKMIDKLSAYIQSYKDKHRGKEPYKDHYAALRSWVYDSVVQEETNLKRLEKETNYASNSKTTKGDIPFFNDID